MKTGVAMSVIHMTDFEGRVVLKRFKDFKAEDICQRQQRNTHERAMADEKERRIKELEEKQEEMRAQIEKLTADLASLLPQTPKKKKMTKLEERTPEQHTNRKVVLVRKIRMGKKISELDYEDIAFYCADEDEKEAMRFRVRIVKAYNVGVVVATASAIANWEECLRLIRSGGVRGAGEVSTEEEEDA